MIFVELVLDGRDSEALIRMNSLNLCEGAFACIAHERPIGVLDDKVDVLLRFEPFNVCSIGTSKLLMTSHESVGSARFG